MTEWTNFRDAYGSAADIPVRIKAWVETPSEERLSDLWSRLCHQGTVYSASFEAIPCLVQACPQLAPKDRRNALMLIAAIWASDDRHDGAEPSDAVKQLAPTIQDMTENSLDDADLDTEDFPYLLQAAAAFRDPYWGRHLDYLASGEFPGVCWTCESHLFMAIGRYGYFASADDYVRSPDAKRSPIASGPQRSMAPIGVWLHERCVQHGQEEMAKGIAHIYGTTTCPVCDASISVVDAIARGTERRPL